jgi:hypothetical protein
MNEDFQYLEWELLTKQISIIKINDSKDLPIGTKTILINRDDDYKLNVMLYYNEEFEIEHKGAGSFADIFEIKGYDEYSRHYTLKHCVIRSLFIPAITQFFIYGAKLTIGEILIERKLKKEEAHLTEWYINGIREPWIFNRPTIRTTSKKSKEYTRKHLDEKEKFDVREEIKSAVASKSNWGMSFDFLKVDFSDFQFFISRVPEEYGPKWSSNVGIEYRRDWGRIPTKDEREMIGELCSFIFGRQLLLVGNTTYDKEGNVSGGYARNPWGKLKTICSEPSYPPINIYESDSLTKVEEIIKQMLPKYFELRNPLHLHEALWFYWISRYTPIGTGLPILWAGLEKMIHGWFRYKKPNHHEVYITKKEFETLLGCDIDIIENKLKGQKFSDNIIQKIKTAYRMTNADTLRIFFKEIQLDVNKQEGDALNSRHEVAHGRIDFNKADWFSWTMKTRAFETLFHKTFLKLLGYSGTYIDRSDVSWLDKNLN